MWLMMDQGELFPFILPGLLDGILAGIVFLFLLVGASGLHKAAGVIFTLIWCIMHLMAYEYARAIGVIGHYSLLSYLSDSVFMEGSGSTLSRPFGEIVLLVLSGGLPLLVRPPDKRTAMAGAAIGLAGLLGVGAATGQGDADWRSANPVLQNLRWAIQRNFTQEQYSSATGAALAIAEHAHEADLSGTPFLRAEGRPNVLLVMLESVSGAYLPSVAGYHRLPAAPIQMRRLDRFVVSSLSVPTFIYNQRQTNRGEYALLCGDLPKLDIGTAKMTETAYGGHPRCLPEVLSKAGYHSLYLQAAPLSFMNKDDFMRSAGFDEALGLAWFKGTESADLSVDGWGVDDRMFFDKALEKLRTMPADKPWFAALLNVGTHHPFQVPDSYKEFEGADERVRAFGFLDSAWGAFAEGLEKHGLLDNTLLIVTADESLGVKLFERLPEELSQNMGFLGIRAPEIKGPIRVETPYQQADLALSIVDYLGVNEKTSYLGRSLFRRYESPRHLFFANVYRRKTYSWDTRGWLTICPFGSTQCEGRDTRGFPLFDLRLPRIKAADFRVAVLNAAVERASKTAVAATETVVKVYRVEQLVPIPPPGEELVMLVDSEPLPIPAGSYIVFNAKMRFQGTKGEISLRLEYMDGEQVVGSVQRPTEVEENEDEFEYLIHIPVESSVENGHFRLSVGLVSGEVRSVLAEEIRIQYSLRQPSK